MIDNLVRLHGRRALLLAERVLGDADEARDAWQETFFAVWKALPRLRRKDDPWPYIRKAVMRKALDRVRSRRQDGPLEGDPPERTPASRDGPQIDLSRLDPGPRAALTLFFWEGLSIREIAAELDAPEGTVKSWMHRGRETLRRQLTPEEKAR